MNHLNEAEKMRYLARMRTFMVQQKLGKLPNNGMNRRDFLKNAGVGVGALALGTAGLGGVLAGCGGGSEKDTSKPLPVGSRMLMSTFLAGTVVFIDPFTGKVGNTLFSKIDDDTTTAGVRRGPGNRVYIFSPGSSRFFVCDITTGEILRTVKSDFTQTSHSGVIGPDGNLYVVNAPSLEGRVGRGGDSIEIFSPDGDHIRTFISQSDVPEMRAPFGIAWGPDGNLYVSSVLAYLPFALGSDYVSKYDGTTGKFLGYVAKNVKVPFNLNFTEDGLLMVIEHFYGRITLFDVGTGKVVDAWASADYCLDIVFGPDRKAYMTSFSDQSGIEALFDRRSNDAKFKGRILRFNGDNGKFETVLSEKLVFAGFLTFV